jgi:glycosyltransferase involved in cell wall biosynthesis
MAPKILATPHAKHYTLGLYNALSRLGVEVSLVTLQQRYAVAARQYVAPRIPAPRSRALAQHILLAFLSHFHDVVHVNSSGEGGAARSYDKLVVTQHGCPDPNAVEESLRWFYEKEERALLSLYEIGVPIVTISNFSAEEMRTTLGVKVAKVIYHGLLKSFKSGKKRSFKQKHVILWVSRFIRFKEPFILLSAIKKLKENHSFTLVMLGDGPLKEQLQRYVRLHGLEKVVIFQEKIPFEHMPFVYRRATIYVHTCSREAFGLSVLEAMGSGLPVVVPDSGGAAEVAADAGLKFKPGDAEDLADKLLAVMQDPELYERLSAKSIERASAFSWEKAAKDYLELYKKVGGW